MTTHQDTPACPVHPYGYHSRERVRSDGSAQVFRDHSWSGVPRRCARLEEELDASGRERDFIDLLWLRERQPRAHVVATLVALVVAAVVIARAAAGDAVETLVAITAVGAALSLLADRVDARLQRERLRRVRDWHKRVGTPR